jgi:hypothetical protein
MLMMPALGKAAEIVDGPAQAAATQWFSSDAALGCVTPDGVDIACGPRNGPSWHIFYGNADGGPGMPDAVAVVTYQSDPTGNAFNAAAAGFRQDPDGHFRLVSKADDVGAAGLVPGAPVVFGNGQAVFTVQAMNPGDSACCLTGTKRVEMPLRH